MKTYRVGLCYSGYVWHEVEAESEEGAFDKAIELEDNVYHDPVITDWDRWRDADQIEETE